MLTKGLFLPIQGLLHKFSARNDVIYSGIKDKNVFVIVERSFAEKLTASKFRITLL